MIYFTLPMTKRGLWVSRVFERNPKKIQNSEAFAYGED
jgi:hypothetical protein